MSNTLTVMKDFFMSNRFMEQAKNTSEGGSECPKKNQGGGDCPKEKGSAAIDHSNSVTTTYHNVLDRVCSEVHEKVDPEITFKK